MKKEREIYLKPLTHREQVVMEQGICSASIIQEDRKGITSNAQGYQELDNSAFERSQNTDGTWEIDWK